MKKKARRQPSDYELDGEEPTTEVAAPSDDEVEVDTHGHSSEICQSLLERYGKSSASQHRHLCATACAMRSILSDEGLPLTPTSYFSAVLTAIRDSDDPSSLSPLSSFLSILLPLVPLNSLPSSNLNDALFSTVIPILRSHISSTVPILLRSLVSALGFLILGLDDWISAKPPIEMLLNYAIDRAPKVRKTAQLYVTKSFLRFKGTTLGKEYRKLVTSMFKEYASRSEEPTETLQMIQLLKLLLPNIPSKKVVEILPEVYTMLRSSSLRTHALSLLEVFVERAKKDEILVSEADEMVSSLAVCVGSVVSDDTTVVMVSSLFKKILCRICSSGKLSLCLKSLPVIFSSLADYLTCKDGVGQHVSEIFKELINSYIHQDLFQTDAHVSLDHGFSSCSPEANAVQTISSLLEKRICMCDDTPDQRTLSVVSDLFLKLGSPSFWFMRDVILGLGQRCVCVTRGSPDIDPIQECIGSAIVAIGPKKMLQLLPISFDEEKMVCSNSWIVPLLRRNVSGASLRFFMDHIVPLVACLKKKFRKGKKSNAAAKDMKSCIQGLWDLLPAFCHYATDVSENFGSLAKLLVDLLKKDASLHRPIAIALQVLVIESRQVIREEKDGENAHESAGIQYDPGSFGLRNSACSFSKKEAVKNVKAVVSSSLDLFDALISAFFYSSHGKNRPYLKGAIECLVPLVGASHLQVTFDLLLKNSDTEDGGGGGDRISDEGKKGGKMGKVRRRSIMMELAFCFVTGADRSLLDEIFSYIKPFVLDGDQGCNAKAYLVLFKALKEQPWFCTENMDELLDILIGKKPSDGNIFRIHLSCLHFLLVYLLRNEEEKEEKAFLILNEIILRLKDPVKELREAAYDMLLGISGSLRESKPKFPGSPLHKLLAMIMGYFSGASPQITSGAVAALSLLVYKDPSICLYEPTLLSSITSLLKKKENEIIKASLGFIKVLVSSMAVTELNNFLPHIVDAVLPWSSVSKNHFRAKVKIIFEIAMRRCGTPVVDNSVPEKYRSFIRAIQDHRKKKASSREGNGSSDDEKMPGDSATELDRKRKYENKYPHGPSKKSKIQENKKSTDVNGRKREFRGGTSSSKGRFHPSRQNSKRLGEKLRDGGSDKMVKRKRHNVAKRKQRGIAKRKQRGIAKRTPG